MSANDRVAIQPDGQLVGARGDELLVVENVTKYFPVTRGIIFQKQIGAVKAVDGVSFTVREGETLGVVGESGCGKSTMARCIMRLLDPTSGRIVFRGRDITKLSRAAMRPVRREMMMVFQDPYASLNVRKRVGFIIAEALEVHKLGTDAEIKRRVQELLEVVGLNPEHYNRFPHEFSVAHDLNVVRHISDRVMVMYLGKAVEVASRDQLYVAPKHPYTGALMSAVPIPNPELGRARKQIVLEGDVPSPINPPSACRFHPRCPRFVQGHCDVEEPLLESFETGHFAACHYPLERWPLSEEEFRRPKAPPRVPAETAAE